MVGITLSSEQIRSAPREVRHWLEQQVMASFGWQPPAAWPDAPQPMVCSEDDIAGILSLVREMIPVVNVLFELGHESAGHTAQGLAAFRLADIQRHARLSDVEQVHACLQIINDALCRVRGNADVTFYGLDDRGFCFIAQATQRSIAALWRQMTPATIPAAAVPATAASVPAAASSPVWSARARPAGADISGTLASDAAGARISR